MTFTFLLNSVSKKFVAVSRFNSVKNRGRTKKAKRYSVKIPQPKRFKTRNNCYGSKPRCVTIMFVKIDFTLLLPECMLESLKVILIFASADRIQWCDHLNETPLPNFQTVLFVFKILQNEIWKFLLNFALNHLSWVGFWKYTFHLVQCEIKHVFNSFGVFTSIADSRIVAAFSWLSCSFRCFVLEHE